MKNKRKKGKQLLIDYPKHLGVMSLILCACTGCFHRIQVIPPSRVPLPPSLTQELHMPHIHDYPKTNQGLVQFISVLWDNDKACIRQRDTLITLIKEHNQLIKEVH